MIISASRRTDIPTYFSEWLFNRFKEGFVLVRNPLNIRQVSRVSLSPDVIDGIVFWTKNPLPMLQSSRLAELDKYNYYFQFTLTAYGNDVEQKLPPKDDVIIPVFQQLAETIGKERVVWRYDPIFCNEKYTLPYHCKYFQFFAERLENYTEKCTVSFLDSYAKMARRTQSLKIKPPTQEQQHEIIGKFAEIAKEHGLSLDTCAEAADFSELGVKHACCIDKERLERIGNYKLAIKKDKNQRPECGCIESIDIGAYDTCQNNCLYCYANRSSNIILRNIRQHNPLSPLLFGEIEKGMDVIKERNVKPSVIKVKSDSQGSLF